jgi:hypothetical protein
VGSTVVSHSPGVCPVAGISSTLHSAVHTVQIFLRLPASVQVGSVVVSHSPGVCPVAGMTTSSSSIALQRVHFI